MPGTLDKLKGLPRKVEETRLLNSILFVSNYGGPNIKVNVHGSKYTTTVVHVAMVVAMAKPFNPDHRETQNLHLFIFVKVHVCGHTCTVNKNTAHNTQYERVSLGSTQIQAWNS